MYRARASVHVCVMCVMCVCVMCDVCEVCVTPHEGVNGGSGLLSPDPPLFLLPLETVCVCRHYCQLHRLLQSSPGDRAAEIWPLYCRN